MDLIRSALSVIKEVVMVLRGVWEVCRLFISRGFGDGDLSSKKARRLPATDAFIVTAIRVEQRRYLLLASHLKIM